MFNPDRMKERRKALGLTCAQLADRLGVHETTVWRWEASEAVPSIARTAELAAALRVPFSVLLRRAKSNDQYAELFGAEMVRRRQPGARVFDSWNDSRDAVEIDGLVAGVREAQRKAGSRA
ncbi:helix-turn-helix domain-containing protein [Kitasatospora sp. NPDC087315]|uniref:helix-turn-helix domain-containing protein n=1 Tax=Kitasatospora sp. NPDC087315 TaxID=3364069 RepID=UPI0038156E3F